MKKSLFLFASLLYAQQLQIDINDISEYIKTHPSDINNRLILASYYLNNNNLKKASKEIKTILKIDPKNKTAKVLLQKLLLKSNLSTFQAHQNNPEEFIKELFLQGRYDEVISFYKFLADKKISDDTLLLVAKAYFLDTLYQDSLNVLEKIKNKNDEYLKLQAYNYYYLKKVFQTLMN